MFRNNRGVIFVNNNTFVGYEAFRSHDTGNTSNTIIGYRGMYGGGSYQHTAMSNNVAIKKLYIVLKITTLNRFLSLIIPSVVSAIRESIIMFR